MTTNQWINFGIMVGTILIPISSIIGLLFLLYKKRILISKYNLYPNGFTDRRMSITKLTEFINVNSQIVNVYGKRGIGKSAFLRFYCDLINKNLDNNNSFFYTMDFKKYRNLKKAKALYVELSGYYDREKLNEQIGEQLTGDQSIGLIKAAKRIKNYLFRSKLIIIVLDNVNNIGLEKDIEDIIRTFAKVSDKFVFLIGSIEKLSLVNLINSNKQYIQLGAFDEKDIYEFARKNLKDTGIDQRHLSRILEVSKGLPIFVNIFIKDSQSSFGANFHIQKYVKSIVNNLSVPAFDLAQYISLLSITKATMLIGDIYNITDFPMDALIELENNALIEYDRIQKTVKMHELYRDYINPEFININQLKIELIYKKISADRIFERSYYLLLLHNEEDREESLMTAINNAVREENYSFLLLIGEHFKLMYNFEPAKAYLRNDVFITIIWGYLQGLVGVGNYPAAQEVVDSCKLTIRNPENTLQFELSILIANLYHLQIKYPLAISTYETLLEYTDKEEFADYQSKCFLGIAHAYRHAGRYPTVAIEYYNKAIASANSRNQKSIAFLCKQELLILHAALSQEAESLALYNDLEQEMCVLPEEYIHNKIAYLKVKARYLRFLKNPVNDIEEINLLNQVLREYSAIKKRLQYNTYFEFGEYYRLHDDYITALDNYKIALIFSKNNLDHNLETMCYLGIILCEIKSEKFLYHEHKFSQRQNLISIIDKCKEYGLYYNSLLAELLLAKISNIAVDKSILMSLKTIGYQREVEIAEADLYGEMMLILM